MAVIFPHASVFYLAKEGALEYSLYESGGGEKPNSI